MVQNSKATMQAALDEALAEGAREADPKEVAEADRRLADLLDNVSRADGQATNEPALSPLPANLVAAGLPAVTMRTAFPLRVVGDQVVLRCRGAVRDIEGEIGPGVSREVIKAAIHNGDAVVLECEADGRSYVVGVLQTRAPRDVTLKGRKIVIEADEEVLLRAGRSAIRVRQDGDVEIVGSRISAMSRGLFRLVGRVLRLN